MSVGIPATARAGETVDAVVWRVLGTSAVEPVLEANPGLAARGPTLPEGLAITLPAAAAMPAAPPIPQLWD
jgi:phage tail protein X